ncbi:MAG: hypothetical protein BSR46_15840 [Candidatus Dactylopiibacterium carminicum]|nr:MAG: hypothetical protein BSR46_15840 [Candidatus Dactylopiibacterium carminicum]
MIACAGLLPAQADQGQAAFAEHCADCHTLRPVSGKRGPPLAGYPRYSSALRDGNIIWTPERLARYLAYPRKDLPGTRMRILGKLKADEITTIIDYLARNPE